MRHGAEGSSVWACLPFFPAHLITPTTLCSSYHSPHFMDEVTSPTPVGSKGRPRDLKQGPRGQPRHLCSVRAPPSAPPSPAFSCPLPVAGRQVCLQGCVSGQGASASEALPAYESTLDLQLLTSAIAYAG